MSEEQKPNDDDQEPLLSEEALKENLEPEEVALENLPIQITFSLAPKCPLTKEETQEYFLHAL